MDKPIIAKLNYLRIPSRKTRFLADVIRGLAVNEAEARLILSPQRSARPLLKLLRSAIANAKHNNKMESEKLFIKEIMVGQGSKFRRFMPRARGGASPIEKKTSHVTIVLGVSEKLKPSKFTIKEKAKKVKTEKKEKVKKDDSLKHEEAKKRTTEKERPVKQKGFFQKMFRRKSI